jgi:hypothetical protein
MNKKTFYHTISVLLICLLVFSCNKKSDIEKVREYYYSNKPDGKFENFRKVIIINELGSCINCNNKFALQMSDSINNKEILFIVSCSGAKVDILPYLDKHQDNIIVDRQARFDLLQITKACAIINLGKQYKITEISTGNICNL